MADNNNTAGIFVAIPAILLLLLVSFSSPPLSVTTTVAQQTPLTPPSLTSPTTLPLTPEELEQQARLQNVIAATTRDLNETEKQVSGIVYTPRWSEPVWVNPNSIAVLVAYCLPGEFADSGQEILGGFGLEVLESYAVDLPQGFMAWMEVVGNEDDIQNGRRLPAAVGVICASDLNNTDTRVLSPQEQQQINNVISQFTTIQNTQITNIDQVINIIDNVTTPQNGTGGGMPPPTNDTGTTQQPLKVRIIPNATQVVAPAYIKFESNVTGGTPPYSYTWDYGSDLDKPNRRSLTLVTVKANTLNVILTVTDNKNHTAYDSVQIPVEGPVPPTAVEIIPNATNGVAPATFKFEMNGNPGSGSREHWFWRLDFGDGTSQYYEQNERTVEHTFKRAGTYNVVLELHAFGGVASDNIVITIKERGPQGGVTVEPSQEPGVPPPTVPGGGEEGDTGGGRGPQGGVTVEPTEEPEGEGEEPSPDEEPTIPPEGQPP